jgi:hypothetical protein
LFSCVRHSFLIVIPSSADAVIGYRNAIAMMSMSALVMDKRSFTLI